MYFHSKTSAGCACRSWKTAAGATKSDLGDTDRFEPLERSGHGSPGCKRSENGRGEAEVVADAVTRPTLPARSVPSAQ